jgi:hypothetical protein
MNSFKQFDIKPTTKGFEGDKIKMQKILNREIIIHDFRIEDSKIYKERGTCKCLHLQISVNDQKHIVFTSSAGLIEMIQKVPENGFPFTTTIVQDGERFLFT